MAQILASFQACDPSRIASISFNQTVAQEDVVLLNCTADGNPEPNITWTRLSDNSIVRMPLNITGKQDEGGYRCTAYNGIGNAATFDVLITVQFYRPINTVFSSSLIKNKVHFKVNFTLVCNADANPSARYRLYKGQESLEEHSNGSYLTHITNRIKQLTYLCIPFNDFGDGPSKTINVTIYYPPNITSISLNQTVAEGDVVQLNCTADGNPEPNITWTRLSNDSIVSMPLTITGKQNEGGYRCTAHNGIGNVVTSDVFIAVQFYRPINTVFSSSLTKNKVNLSDNFTLTCNADANPSARYRLYKGQESLEEHSNGSYLTFVSTRTKLVTYRCIPFNYLGDGHSKTIIVTVYYAAEATGKGRNYSVPEGSSKRFSCPVDGNPEPNITWYKDNEVIEPEIPNAKQMEARETGCYTCSAINALGPPVTITQCLIVVLEETTSATPTSTGKPTKQVYADLTIMEDFLSEYRDLNNQVSKQLVDSFVSEMNKAYQNDDNYLRTEVTGLRTGSVIVSFTIYFKNAVIPSQGISKLEAAISDGTFGTYQVGNLTLLLPGTSTFTSTTPGTSQPTEFQCACDRTLLVIIGVLVSIIIVLILVIAWQHRKLGLCRKKRCFRNDLLLREVCNESLQEGERNGPILKW
ncbi:MAM domain-containing glycosylphosphatidylinositol anchor protein 1-like [Montipora capricornis]|uniref:MAM domain-containing glycosylphosphatidylinositol anchor protein 1-like n=1 Tax=Montipora capricornis TaxID=246305 RepID=UPI0035F1D8A1